MRTAALVRFATLLVLAVWTLPCPSFAQCSSNASSCVNCHEAQALRPVLQSAQAWHRDHGFGDLCAACHGGDPSAVIEEQAHVGLRQPLADVTASCAGCHPRDAAERAARYVPAAAAPVQVPPPPPAAGAGASSADRALIGVALMLGAALYFSFRRAPRGGVHPIRWLRQKSWSAYTAGAALGVIVAASQVIYARPLAVSGAFDKLAAYPGHALFPRSQYYDQVMTPAITWQVWLVCGVLLGAFASSRWSGQAQLRWLPDSQWETRFGRSRQRRLALAFIGAALVQFGAGIAGGCTSGLAISGGAVLAPGAFVFMAGMFASGIPTAWLWYRTRRT